MAVLWVPRFCLFTFWKETLSLFLLLSTAVLVQVPQAFLGGQSTAATVQTANLESKFTVQGWPLLLAHFALHIALLPTASPQLVKAALWKLAQPMVLSGLSGDSAVPFRPRQPVISRLVCTRPLHLLLASPFLLDHTAPSLCPFSSLHVAGAQGRIAGQGWRRRWCCCLGSSLPRREVLWLGSNPSGACIPYSSWESRVGVLWDVLLRLPLSSSKWWLEREAVHNAWMVSGFRKAEKLQNELCVFGLCHIQLALETCLPGGDEEDGRYLSALQLWAGCPSAGGGIGVREGEHRVSLCHTFVFRMMSSELLLV